MASAACFMAQADIIMLCKYISDVALSSCVISDLDHCSDKRGRVTQQQQQRTAFNLLLRCVNAAGVNSSITLSTDGPHSDPRASVIDLVRGCNFAAFCCEKQTATSSVVYLTVRSCARRVPDRGRNYRPHPLTRSSAHLSRLATNNVTGRL
jgi:hypothetical protein